MPNESLKQTNKKNRNHIGAFDGRSPCHKSIFGNDGGAYLCNCYNYVKLTKTPLTFFLPPSPMSISRKVNVDISRMEAHCIEYTRTEWEESASVSFQLPQMILQLYATLLSCPCIVCNCKLTLTLLSEMREANRGNIK